MKYKVLAFDIDGTLVNSKKEITPRTKEAITAAAKQGCKIVIASGRPAKGIDRYVEELNLKELGGYVLCTNGAKIISCADGSYVHNILLPQEYYGEICDLAKSEGVHLMTYDYEGNTVVSETIDDPYLQLEARINGLARKEIPDMKTFLDYPVNKFLMLGDGDVLTEVEKHVWEKLHDRMEVYRSEPFFLEIMPKNVHKAFGLEKLIESLGVKREELMAFGDGYNDKTMLEYAGMGVAMSNGVEATKAAADYIAPSNNEDGIAEVIRKFVLD